MKMSDCAPKNMKARTMAYMEYVVTCDPDGQGGYEFRNDDWSMVSPKCKSLFSAYVGVSAPDRQVQQDYEEAVTTFCRSTNISGEDGCAEAAVNAATVAKPPKFQFAAGTSVASTVQPPATQVVPAQPPATQAVSAQPAAANGTVPAGAPANTGPQDVTGSSTSPVASALLVALGIFVGIHCA